MNKVILTIIIVLATVSLAVAQDHNDVVITGHVVSKGEHIPFVNIYLEGTRYGTTTDVTGHYMMVDLPTGE